MKRAAARSQDYYAVLQVEPEASIEEVRAAYKRLALLHHPDRSRHPKANQRMQLLNEAYAVLGSPEKRSRYDQERRAAVEVKPGETAIHQDQPARVNRKEQQELEHRRNRLMRSQLKLILYLILLTLVMFLWFLASGQVSYFMILLIVAMALFALASMVMNVRNMDR
jgi:Flp pilus assembly protein TadB